MPQNRDDKEGLTKIFVDAYSISVDRKSVRKIFVYYEI